jgi:hypothetical protein
MRSHAPLTLIVLLAFLANTFGPSPKAMAEDFFLPAPGAMVELSAAFNPPILKGLKVHPDNPFRFDFILEGNQNEASKLIKYFLAGLTIPEADLWVNLSPYEKDRIVPQAFGQTAMGREFIKEFMDNGDGHPLGRALALIIPKSTKAASHEKGIVGFFGTGKFTIYAGADRVEIITNNGQEAYVFKLEVDQSQGRVFLTAIGQVNPANLPQGVTVRQIQKTAKVLPELEQMLDVRAWKAFAGMSVNDHFHIKFQKGDGFEELMVKGKQLLSATDFWVHSPKTGQLVNEGKMRIWMTQDAEMPIQVVDQKGLRVDDLKVKESFLDLVPQELRHYVKDLRLVIQIPLPLIQNRSSFEREEEYLPQIQKYVAVEFYKALVHKRLIDESFYLNPLPRDWETNDDAWYNDSLDPSLTRGLRLSGGSPKHLFDVLRQINNGAVETLDYDDLEAARDLFNHNQRALIAFLVQVEAQTEMGRSSLLMRRIKALSQLASQRAEAQRLAARTGVDYNHAVQTHDPYSEARTRRLAGIERAHDDMHMFHHNPQAFIQEPRTEPEKTLLALGKRFGQRIGIDNVYLVKSSLNFAGSFVHNGQGIDMYLNARFARDINSSTQGDTNDIHAAANTIPHEITHLFEDLEELSLNGRPYKDLFLATDLGGEHFTHDQHFMDLMKRAAAVILTPKANTEAHLDAAMKGGIDLSKVEVDSRFRGNDMVGNGNDTRIRFHIDPAQLARLRNASGFVPVIINIQPLKSLPEFLGIAEKAGNSPEVG